ncbi:HNH endonuclease [Virgibacillus halodenitrificans]|uniref:HNH endonuclease n=1 Tax=Virgibacillus halodenitrificans TaxID=1482 RepID=UPI001F2FEBAD|nr:HNH endonuclease [Virgibacillus halodenitrificans]
MVYKPKRPCNEPGCNILTNQSYCDEHKKNYNKEYDKLRDSSNKRGYNYRWQKYTESFLIRNPLCQHCIDRGDTVPATEVDHITPHRGNMKLFWDPNNHQGLCKSCHSRKTRKGF